MLEILFLNRDTGFVNYAVTGVSLVRYITSSEIGFTYEGGRDSSCAFPKTERLEVSHKTDSPLRMALLHQAKLESEPREVERNA